MKRLLVPSIAAATALFLAACGSADDDNPSAAAAGTESTAPDSSAPDSSDAASSTPSSTPDVDVQQIEEFGNVLVDAEGRVLYTADEEVADPDVICTDACEEFWVPVEAQSDTPTGGEGVTGLDVAERPDGTMQVTLDGTRLYTFVEDDPGEATGDGFSDEFDGQRFTWHVAVVEAGTDSTAVTGDSGAATTGTDDAPADTSTDTTTAGGDIYDDPGY